MGSIFMFKRKVSPEEKITAVESYLNGDRQLHTILEQYGIAKESFRTWVRNYQIFGGEGLREKHRKASYSSWYLTPGSRRIICPEQVRKQIFVKNIRFILEASCKAG